MVRAILTLAAATALGLASCACPDADRSVNAADIPADGQERLVLDGILRQISRAPKFTIYRWALVLYTYEVAAVIAGEYPHDTIQVYHWAIIDHKLQRQVVERARGQTYRLVVEPFARYPALATEDRTETVMDFSLPLFMDVGAGDPMAPLRTRARPSP